MPRPMPFKYPDHMTPKRRLRPTERRREAGKDLAVILILVTLAGFIALLMA